ncbi:MAG: hypothetical protein Q9165_005710 [Trypethelium subeluteriae]
MESVSKPYDQCIQYLVENIKLDPYFNDYFQWSLKNNIPTVVLSSGMEPIIRALLKNLVGPDHDKIDIVSNHVKARPGKSINDERGWELEFHDDSHFGHDKSLTIRPYAQLPASTRPVLFYAGDGVSDLSAAKETDLLFAKKGHGMRPILRLLLLYSPYLDIDLIEYCVKEDIPFTVFEDWSSIKSKVQEIVAGTTRVEDAAKEGYQQYKSGQAGVDVNKKE